MSVDSWSLHPDFWETMAEVDYSVAYARARWLAALLRRIAGFAAAPVSVRLGVELYGVGSAVLADGTVIAWIGADPDDAELWAQLDPDEWVPLDARVWEAA